MTESQARILAGALHDEYPKLALKRGGQWRPKAATWVKYLMVLDHETTNAVVGDYISGATAIPRNNEKPQLADIRSEVRTRLATKRQHESFQNARARPIRLKQFRHGDYVVLDPPRVPHWPTELPGGRVEKSAQVDIVRDIPMHISNCMGMVDGYHLMCYVVTNPADLKHITLMNDEQREAWVREMRRLEAAGQFSKFKRPWLEEVRTCL